MSAKQIAGSDLFRYTNVRVSVTEQDNLLRDIDLPLTIYRWSEPRNTFDWSISQSESSYYLITPIRSFPDGNSLVLYRTIGIREQFILGSMTEEGKEYVSDQGYPNDSMYEDRRRRNDLASYFRNNKEWSRELLAERNKSILEQENIAEQPLKWYIKTQANMDRPGLRGFGTLPLRLVPDLWERPMNPKNLSIHGSPHSRIRFTVEYHHVSAERITISWPNLIYLNGMETHYPALQWCKDNCVGEIVPFSVFPSMFVEPMDEIAYQERFDGDD